MDIRCKSNFSIVAGKLKKRKVPFWLLKVHSKSKIQKLPADIEKLRVKFAKCYKTIN